MAGPKVQSRFYNLILGLVLLVMLVLSTLGDSTITTLALEQQVRCGITEHTHSEECYLGGVLLCREKAHVHSEGCYLILLEDNDINWLLETMGTMEDRSLEEVIDSALAQALVLNSGFTATEPTVQLNGYDISSLNNTIANNGIEPSLVLNQNLSVGSTLAYTPTNPLQVETLGLDDVTVGDSSSSRPLYIEIYIVSEEDAASGEWIRVSNSLTYAMTRLPSTRYKATRTTDITNTINGAVDSTVSSYALRYGSGSSWTAAGSRTSGGTAYTTFGTGNSNTTGAVTARLYNSGGSTVMRFCLITYENTDGTTQDTAIYLEGATVTLLDPGSGYVWVDQDGNRYSGGAQVTLSKSLTLRKQTASLTAHFVNGSHVQIAQSYTANPVGGKLTVTLPSLAGTAYEGFYWILADGSSTDFYSSDGNRTASITRDTVFMAVPSTYTVTFVDEKGNRTTQTVGYRDTVTFGALPETFYWHDSDGNRYSEGASSGPITQDTTFTAATRALTLVYNVNFPSSLSGKTLYPEGGLGSSPAQLGVSAVGVPTMAANMGSTYTVSGFINLGIPHRMENLNYREVFYYLYDGNSRGPAYEFRSVYFKGWQATANGQTVAFAPGEAIDWPTLNALASETTGVVNFEGLWETNPGTTVTFYVNYSAAAVDAGGNYTSGSAADYTPEVFCGHLFGLSSDRQTNGHNANPNNSTLYGITGQSATTSLDADARIRQLYGTGVDYDGTYVSNGQTLTAPGAATTLYMTDFPTDAEVLEKIKTWAAKGTLTTTLRADNGDGTTFAIPYNTNSDGSRDYYDLDTDHYTIRWYVFKSQSDGWHVDGRLIKKVGTIKVTKQFEGNAGLVADAIAATRNAYTNGGKAFVDATCQGHYETVGGVQTFVSYDTPKTARLYFFPSTGDGDGGYEYDPSTGTYSWIITGVEANQIWTVTEHPEVPDNSMDVSEWIWVDSFNGTTDTGNSRSTTVTGVTHAADSYSEDWLVVDFTNVYHKENTILIRKVDGKTMTGLSGAVFNLYQSVDGEEQLMYFTYDQEEQIYVWNPGDTGITDLVVNASGYLEYTVSGFSYGVGNIIVREKKAPGGYALTSDVVVGYLPGTDETIGIVNGGENDTAEYLNGILTVKNYSDGEATVKAIKAWDCDSSYYKGYAVKMELWANGRVASGTIPGFADTYGSYYIYLDARGAYVTTNADGTPNYISNTPWTYTWTGLPTVISGEAVTYTLVETQIGDEVADSSGNFPNWISDEMYNTVATDEFGNQTVTIAIRNTPNRAMVRLTKYELGGSGTIPGVTFSFTEVGTTTTVTKTTDSYGVITFDNLKYETWYRLEETVVPEGYFPIGETVYFKLAATGVVTVTTDLDDTTRIPQYVRYPNQANNIHVYNMKQTVLPETGGPGTFLYTQAGLLLMAAAVCLLAYKKHRRKGVPSDV